MSPEERDELMDFILQSQSDAAERHQEAMKQHQEAMKRMDAFGNEMRESTAQLQEHTAQLREHTEEIKVLASLSRDFLEVSRIHSRRQSSLQCDRRFPISSTSSLKRGQLRPSSPEASPMVLFPREVTRPTSRRSCRDTRTMKGA